MEGIGSAIGSLFSTASGAINVAGGLKQIDEAKKVRRSADYIQKEKLRPEYQRKLRATEMAALQGLPGKDAYYDAFEQQSANAIENIKRASPNSASTLAAISASLADERQRKQQLQAMEAKGRAEGQQRAAGVIGEIAAEERKLELERTRKQENVFAAADQLEKAGTANVYRGLSSAMSSMGMGSGALFNSALKSNQNADTAEGVTESVDSGLDTTNMAALDAGVAQTPNTEQNQQQPFVADSNMNTTETVGQPIGEFQTGIQQQGQVNDMSSLTDDQIIEYKTSVQRSGQQMPQWLIVEINKRGLF